MGEKERELIRNIQTYDLAEWHRLRRAQAAKESGLPVEEFAKPYPISSVQTHHHYYADTPSAPAPKKFWTLGSLITFVAGVTALVLLLSSAGAFAIWKLAVPASPANGMQFDVEWQDENGKWNKIIKPK